MTAKERHQRTMVEYLSDPNNPFPTREALAEVCGISRVTMYSHFKPAELTLLEKEALALRRTMYAPDLSKVDAALLREAELGNPQAVKLAYQRFEGWSEKTSQEISGPNGGPVEANYWVNFVQAEGDK